MSYIDAGYHIQGFLSDIIRQLQYNRDIDIIKADMLEFFADRYDIEDITGYHQANIEVLENLVSMMKKLKTLYNNDK